MACNNFRRILTICWVPANVVEQFPCSSCDEILSLDSRAGSGNYFITSEDGKTLQEVSLLLLTFKLSK